MPSKSNKVASSAPKFNPLLPTTEASFAETEGSERTGPPPSNPTREGRSVTGRSSATGTSATSPYHSMDSSAESTSLTELVDLDRKYKNRFVKAWVHSRISIRLLLMLLIPFTSLIILLVIVISGEAASSSNATRITVLADLTQDLLLLIAELSSEYTDCLWWILSRDLSVGIQWTSGGVNDVGMRDQIYQTDLRISDLLQFSDDHPMYSVDNDLAAKLAVAQFQLNQISDVRYNVQRFRYFEDDITGYYLPLVDLLLDAVDRIATLADTATVEYAQALVSWSRAKTAYERERQTVGMILLQKNFTLAHFTDWHNIEVLQTNWQNRFLAIAPDALLASALAFINGPLVLTVQEMRYQGFASFVPGNPAKIPSLNFRQWMGNCSLLINYMRDYRANVTEEIIAIANSNKSTSATTLGLYILLACLAAGISILVGLLVGWSIDAPWCSMLRMKDRMYVRLTDEEAVQNRNKESANASLQIDTGVAIHTGDLMLGTVGDQVRMDTAIISEALSIALQVSSLTIRYQASLLVTRETFMVLNIEGITARFLGESGVQGLHIHPQVYEVLRPSDEGRLDTLNEFLQAVKLHQEGNFSSAADLYRSVLQADPSDAVARIRLQLAERREWVDVIS